MSATHSETGEPLVLYEDDGRPYTVREIRQYDPAQKKMVSVTDRHYQDLPPGFKMVRNTDDTGVVIDGWHAEAIARRNGPQPGDAPLEVPLAEVGRTVLPAGQSVSPVLVPPDAPTPPLGVATGTGGEPTSPNTTGGAAAAKEGNS